MCKNQELTEEEIHCDNLLYKKMYLRMVKAVLDTEKILNEALQECEEIFISKNGLDSDRDSTLIIH